MEKTNIKPLKVGELFALYGNAFCIPDRNDLDCWDDNVLLFPMYNTNIADHYLQGEEASKLSNNYFIFKYIGNGKVMELASKREFFITDEGSDYPNDYDEDYLYTYFDDGRYANWLFSKESYANAEEFIKFRDSFKEYYKDKPLIISAQLEEAERNLDDNFKKEYIKLSDEERVELINKIYNISLEVAKNLGKEIPEGSYRSAMLDNNLYDNQNLKKK